MHGNVWYMGEFETDFVRDKHGKIIKVVHPDTWQAGVNGGKPGFIMEAHPKVGDDYFQEHAPPTAVDTAKVTAVGLTLDVEGKTYHEVILTKELSALEPGVVDFKWYAPGIRLVLEREYPRQAGRVQPLRVGHAERRRQGWRPRPRRARPGAAGPGAAQDGGNAAALTTAHTVAYVGMPFGLPADSHIPALDLTVLF